MKKYLVLTMCACVMLAACDKGLTRGKSKSDYKAADGKPFNGPDFEIDMPEGWQIQKGVMGTAMMATSAKEDPRDQFQENMNITLENVPSSMGLDKYVKISIENARKMLSDYKSVEQEKVTINGMEFCRIVALYKVGVVSIKGLLYIGIKDGGAYNVTCTASPETYDKFKPGVRKGR